MGTLLPPQPDPQKLPKIDAIITKFGPKRGGIPRLLAKLEQKYKVVEDSTSDSSWEERVGL